MIFFTWSEAPVGLRELRDVLVRKIRHFLGGAIFLYNSRELFSQIEFNDRKYLIFVKYLKKKILYHL